MQPAIVQPTQPVVYDAFPKNVICPNCHQNVTTTCAYETGTMTYLVALLLCFLICPCFWVPFCIDGCKDVHHTCPSCHTEIGFCKRW